MIREKAMQAGIGKAGSFRWRGHEISRIEGLSDAVFAFAVTLLVVSLEVPKTFNELAESALHCCIAVVSLLLILIGGAKFAGWAGLAYMLTGAVMGIHGTMMGKRRRRLEKSFLEEFEAQPVEN